MENLKITPISELIESSRGEIVALPSFREGCPFVARLKRPSMLMLTKSGRIPNSLIASANKLFNGKGVDGSTGNTMKDAFDVFETLCEASFVEPTYAQLKEAGVELTDEQFMAVFNYTQAGAKSLAPFRGKQADSVPPVSGSEVSGKTVEAPRN